jgi:hypothetical protein
MEEIKDKNVMLTIDCWKYVFSWRTLGGCYIRCFLIFTEDSLVELETSHSDISPPFKRGSYGYDLLSNVFWGIIDTIFYEIKGYGDKLNKEVYKNKTLKIKDFLNFLNKNKIKYKIKNILSYNELKYIKVKEKGKVSIKRDDLEFSLEIVGEKKRKYEAYLPEKSIYNEICDKFKSLLYRKIYFE